MSAEITSGIDSHKEREQYEVRRALAAIAEGNYSAAIDAVARAMAHRAAIEELYFQLEVREVEHV